MQESAKWGLMTLIACITLVVILATQTDVFDANSTSESPEQNLLESSSDNPDPLAFDCVDHSGLDRHHHATLRIYIDGAEKEMPSPIGISTGVCNQPGAYMHIVHVHDNQPNTLHIETNEPVDVPLGVFFDIWDVHFNETGIFDYRVNETHGIRMTVDGVESTEFDELLLLDGQSIAIFYELA
jgi:hypothetical protein